MLTSSDFSGLVNERFLRNFLPIPARNVLSLGSLAPDFELPDITNKRSVKLSDYHGQQPVILAFTRIFTEKQYCPLCYPHIKQLNEQYERFVEAGTEILMITSTDFRQSKQVVQDLKIKMPLLSNSSCDVFRLYEVGQALGAPLSAQFVLDTQGKIQLKHLFSFFSPNAKVEKLLAAATKKRVKS